MCIPRLFECFRFSLFQSFTFCFDIKCRLLKTFYEVGKELRRFHMTCINNEREKPKCWCAMKPYLKIRFEFRINDTLNFFLIRKR